METRGFAGGVRFLHGIRRELLPDGAGDRSQLPPGYEGRLIAQDGWRTWQDDRDANPRYELCECGWATDRLAEHHNVPRDRPTP
jgi:hypothetical protein